MTPQPTDIPASGRREDGTLDPATFRAVMSQWVTGIAVVTSTDAGVPVGIVCNSLTSVSLDPLLLLWTVDRKSSSFDHWMRVSDWAIHFLAEDQKDLVKQFAQKGGDKFAGLDFQFSANGVPLLPNALVRLECRTWNRMDAGDHVVIVGEVDSFQQRIAKPLTFVHGSLVAANLPEPTK